MLMIDREALITIKGPKELYSIELLCEHRVRILREETKNWTVDGSLGEYLEYAKEVCKVSKDLPGP